MFSVTEAAMEKSFAKAGKTMAHEMRHRISMCRNVPDLENTFSEMSGKVLSKVIGSGADELTLRGIVFDTGSKNHFRISDQLDHQQLFREAWYRSDLPEIIGHFAQSVWHHYLHLQKTSPRANLKIRI